MLLLLRVLAAIELDRELAAGTREIDDMRSDRMLPPKAALGRKLRPAKGGRPRTESAKITASGSRQGILFPKG